MGLPVLNGEMVTDMIKIVINDWIKVSEYTFKQNKDMLKNTKVLLHTYFYNISLNVLRPTFFGIYNLPFSRSTNIKKLESTLGHTFPTFWVTAPTEMQFSIYFFHWYVASQRTNKTARDFLLFKYFLNNLFSTVFMQNTLSKLVELLKQKMNNLLLVKAWTRFCAAVCQKSVCKSLKLIFPATFVLELIKFSQPRNHCLPKFF